ncbi:MAG: right-handed parallel beta-helix repeat-containing protein [Candidatus Hydrogenedentota bacterium]
MRNCFSIIVCLLALIVPARGSEETAPIAIAASAETLLVGPEMGPAIILDDGAELKDMHIVGRDSSLLGCAVLVRGRGVRIINCEIEGGPGTGILVLGGEAIMESVTIHSSREGISARASALEISRSHIWGNTSTGIDLEEGSSLAASHTSVNSNGGDGLVLGALATATFETVTIATNSGYGIRSLYAIRSFDTTSLVCVGNGRGPFLVDWLSTDHAADSAVTPPSQEAALRPNSAEEIAPVLALAGFAPDDLRLPSDRLADITPLARSALDSPWTASSHVTLVAEHILESVAIGTALRAMVEAAGGSMPEERGRLTLVEAAAVAHAFVSELPSMDELETAVLIEESEPTLLENHFGVEREQAEAERLGMISSSVDLGSVAGIMQLLLDAAMAMDSSAVDFVERPAGVEGKLRAAWKTEAGWIVVGDTGANRYPAGIAFIIDAGGDDHYRDAACVENSGPHIGSGADSVAAYSLVADPWVSVVIDYGGDDLYEGRTASAKRGFALLVDFGGNDRYIGGDRTQAAVIGGGALLWDREGDDHYRGGRGCQAFAVAGLSLLMDDAGSDEYSAASSSQAFSGTHSAAALVDRSGDDQYVLRGGDADSLRDPSMRVSYGQAFAVGLRPGPAGGVALLLDGGGHDYYKCDLFGQGVGYWGGIGALVDWSGSDVYRGYYYVQGAGVHLAAGLLIDRAGRDYYQSWTVSQGCGHDMALGILIDESGDDLYRADNLTQGAGNSNGIGFLLDCSGNDRYMLDHGMSGQGYGVYENLIRRYGSLGVFLDLAGEDFYSGKGRDGTSWMNGEVGVGMDR